MHCVVQSERFKYVFCWRRGSKLVTDTKFRHIWESTDRKDEDSFSIEQLEVDHKHIYIISFINRNRNINSFKQGGNIYLRSMCLLFLK